MILNRVLPLKRLLILLTALGLLPIAVVGAWTINFVQAEQQREAERAMLGLSRALASAITIELDGVVSSLRTLSYSPALHRGDIPSFYRMAVSTAKGQPDFSGIILADGEGEVIFKTVLPLGSHEKRVSEPASIMRALATHEPVVGQISRGQMGTWGVPVRVPVMIDGRVAYVLTAVLTAERFRKLLQHQHFPDSWVVSIQDDADRRVARSREHENTVGLGLSPTLASMLAKGHDEGTGVSRTLDGEEVTTAYARLPRYRWSVAVGAPTSEARSGALRGYALHAAGLAASLALCVGLALLISRRIVRAMSDLQEQARRLGEGQTAVPVTTGIAEIRQVGQELALAAERQHAAAQEREQLMDSLNMALASLREALSDAEKNASAKDNFLAVLGHELRNPLAPINSGAELLLHMGAEEPRVREIAGIIHRQASHMGRIVDDLLDVSRLVRGLVELDRRPTDLRQLVLMAADQVRPLIDDKQQRLELDLPEQPVLVDADETRLAQAIANVLTNAARYTQDEGRIVISLGLANGSARLLVTDNGQGISAELMPQIFDLFTQGKRDAARSGGGLGIGLALVKKLVEFHGGTVHAASDGPGCGSQFTITLPLHDREGSQASDNAQAADRDGASPARVLLVDDNLDAARVLGALLGMDGHTVSLAENGERALALARAGEFDVVILDIGLPDIDGYAVAASLRADPRSADWYIISVSGYAQPGDRSSSEAAGIDVHLAKPVSIGALRKLIAGRFPPADDGRGSPPIRRPVSA